MGGSRAGRGSDPDGGVRRVLMGDEADVPLLDEFAHLVERVAVTCARTRAEAVGREWLTLGQLGGEGCGRAMGAARVAWQ